MPYATLACMAGVVIFGPTIDMANARAGLLTIGAGAALAGAFMIVPVCTRLAILSILMPTGMVAALAALTLSPPELLKGPAGGLWSALHASGVSIGTQVHPNTVAFLIVPALVGAFGLLTQNPTDRPYASIITITLGLAVLAIAGARAETVGAGVAAAAVLIAQGRFAKWPRTLWICVVLAASAATIYLASRLLDEPSIRDRVRYWPAAMEQLSQSPLFGIGYGRLAYSNADPARGSIHNTALQIGLDFGVLCAALFALTAVLSALATLKTYRRARHDSARSLAIGALGAMIALYLSGSAESVVESPTQLADGFLTLVSPVPFILSVIGLPSIRIRPREVARVG